jgi:hypothetical protein
LVHRRAAAVRNWDNRAVSPKSLGYDWHNIMHMISGLVGEDIHRAMTEQRPFDRDDYARRLRELPADWPPPEQLGPR